ncbi:MAG: FAD-dependent oxidoreductase, partial [Acidimicrobiales bacterium]
MPHASDLAHNSQTVVTSHTVVTDVAVLGGGVIGLATAWRAAQAGLTTCVIDPAPGSGASGVAAGMLAPVTEAHFGEEALLALNLASADMYPAFVAELEADAGLQVGYRTCGTLAVAADADDWAVLERLARYQAELGLPVTSLSAREARQAEPALSPAIRGAMVVEGDHQVDNRRLHAALAQAARHRGVRFITDKAQRLICSDAGVSAVALAGQGRVQAGQVVVALGAWSGCLEGIPGSDVVPVRPLRGQV